MGDVIVTVLDNGPYRVTGVQQLKDATGADYEARETYFLCRCGQSANKPFCDGTHNTVGFQSAPRAGK
jgi:CDGSH-type Zn-finger protein